MLNSKKKVFYPKQKIYINIIHLLFYSIKFNNFGLSKLMIESNLLNNLYKNFIFINICKKNTFRTMSRGPIAKKKKSLLYFNKPSFFKKLYYFSNNSYFNFLFCKPWLNGIHLLLLKNHFIHTLRQVVYKNDLIVFLWVYLLFIFFFYQFIHFK